MFGGIYATCIQSHTRSASPTQQCGQRPQVLLHQRVDLLLREAADAVAVHLPAHHAAVQAAQQPLQRVAQGAAHRQELLSFLQVVHPLTVGDRPETQKGVQCSLCLSKATLESILKRQAWAAT